MNSTLARFFIGTAFFLFASMSGISSAYFAVVLTQEFSILVQVIAGILVLGFLMVEYTAPFYAAVAFTKERGGTAWAFILIWFFVASYSFLAGHGMMSNLTQATEATRLVESTAYQEAKTSREQALAAAQSSAVSESAYRKAKSDIDFLQSQKENLMNGTVRNSQDVPVPVAKALNYCTSTSYSGYISVCNQVQEIDNQISYANGVMRRYQEYQGLMSHAQTLQSTPIPYGATSANIAAFESIARLFNTNYENAKTGIFTFIAGLVVLLSPILTILMHIVAPTRLPFQERLAEKNDIKIHTSEQPAAPAFKREAEQPQPQHTDVVAKQEALERALKQANILRKQELSNQKKRLEEQEKAARKKAEEKEREEWQARQRAIGEKLANAKRNAQKIKRSASTTRYSDNELLTQLKTLIQQGKVEPTTHGLKTFKEGYQMNTGRAKRLLAILAKEGFIRETTDGKYKVGLG